MRLRPIPTKELRPNKMAISNNIGQNGMGQFNTLAVSGTAKPLETAIILNGKGSDLSNTKQLKGKAKRKIISRSLTLSLIDIAKEKGNDTMIKSLWRTYYCQEVLITNQGKVHGKYCKNRICTLCNANRKADIINRYLPTIEKWPDPQFLTLTTKSVDKKNLKRNINGMVRSFQLIKERQKKRYQRGTGIKLIGIKSLECNFNPRAKTYNPHFHLVLPDKATSDLMKKEWLKTWTPKWANKKGQFNRPIRQEKVKDLIETVKYGSKIFTDPDLKKTGHSTSSHKVYAAALYNILTAMDGHRLYERFGFNLPKQNKKTKSKLVISSDTEKWYFDPKSFDWVNSKTAEVLTDYNLPNELSFILENNIDLKLE